MSAMAGKDCGQPAVVLRAVRLMERDPRLGTEKLNALLREAGVGRAVFDDEFALYVGMAPYEYLRVLRLSQVHAELAAARPERTRPEAVARRWGFRYGTAFVRWYSQQFAELPAQTLRG